ADGAAPVEKLRRELAARIAADGLVERLDGLGAARGGEQALRPRQPEHREKVPRRQVAHLAVHLATAPISHDERRGPEGNQLARLRRLLCVREVELEGDK